MAFKRFNQCGGISYHVNDIKAAAGLLRAFCGSWCAAVRVGCVASPELAPVAPVEHWPRVTFSGIVSFESLATFPKLGGRACGLLRRLLLLVVRETGKQ